ncbi:MAG: hypothetical protein K2Q09_02215 [Phycisphaerales bacterium]|nr:hypothetical protein [Phycisphaerales bacterium]
MALGDSFIKYPLAAAMLAAMGGAGSEPGSGGRRACESCCGIVARAEVPAPALDAIVREAGGLDFGPVTIVERDGAPLYAADMVRDGHVTGVEVDSLGAVRGVTTEIEAWELPTAVKRIVDAETLGFPARSFCVTTRGGETVYSVDAATERRGKQLEIDPLGRVVNKVLKIG